jgi:hypothetical protein
MIRFAAVLMCLALASCSSAPAQEPPAAELGAEITLSPGTSANVKSAEMKVRFVAVTEDSRCPRDVTCIWAGEVKVQLEFQTEQGVSRVEIVEGRSAEVGSYRVTIVRVEPQPVSTVKIAAPDYRVTLKVDSSAA